MQSSKLIIFSFSVMSTLAISSIVPMKISFLLELYAFNFIVSLIITTISWNEVEKCFFKIYDKKLKIINYLEKGKFAGFEVNRYTPVNDHLDEFVIEKVKKNSLLRSWLRKIIIGGAYFTGLKFISGDILFSYSYSIIPIFSFLLLAYLTYWGLFLLGAFFYLVLFCFSAPLETPGHYLVYALMFFLFFFNLSWLNTYYWSRLSGKSIASFRLKPLFIPLMIFSFVFVISDSVLKGEKSLLSQLKFNAIIQPMAPRLDVLKAKTIAESLPDIKIENADKVFKEKDILDAQVVLSRLDQAITNYQVKNELTAEEMANFLKVIEQKTLIQQKTIPKLISEYKNQKSINLKKIKLRNTLQKLDVDMKKLEEFSAQEVNYQTVDQAAIVKPNAFQNNKSNIQKINELMKNSTKKISHSKKKIKELKNKQAGQIKTKDKEKRDFDFMNLVVCALGIICVLWVFYNLFRKNKITEAKHELSKDDKDYLRKLLKEESSYTDFADEVDQQYRIFHQAMEKLFFGEHYAPPPLIIPLKEEYIPIEKLRKNGNILGKFFNAVHFAKYSKFSVKDKRIFRKNFKYFKRYLEQQVK